MEAPQQRKGRSVDAIKKAGEHPAVITAVARLFWNERKVEKARQWFGNAITADKDWGDAWGWWLKFERQHGELVSHTWVEGFAFCDAVGRSVVVRTLASSSGDMLYSRHLWIALSAVIMGYKNKRVLTR